MRHFELVELVLDIVGWTVIFAVGIFIFSSALVVGCLLEDSRVDCRNNMAGGFVYYVASAIIY